MRDIHSINFKFYLPAFVLLSAFILYVSTSLFYWLDERRELIDSGLNLVQFDMATLSRELEDALEPDHHRTADEVLMYRSINSNYLSLFLVRLSDLKVIASASKSTINQDLYELSELDHHFLGEFATEGSSKIHFDEKKEVVHAYSSIRDPNSNYTNERQYILISRYSLKSKFQQQQQALIIRSVVEAALFALFSMLLIFLYRRYFARPFESLMQGLALFSNKPQTIESKITGRGEFKQLSDAFYQMSQAVELQIEETTRLSAEAIKTASVMDSFFSAIRDLFFIMDEELTILDYRAEEDEMLYVPASTFLNKKMHEVLPPDVGALFVKHASECFKTGKLCAFEYSLRVNSVEEVFEARLARIKESQQLIALIRDVTDRKRNEDFIQHQAFYDSLTGLPNRYLALERIKHSFESSKRTKSRAAVIFVDLDDFKLINDTLGHDVGDEILIETSSRLKAMLRESDTIARLGGDEFVLLLEEVASNEDIAHLMAGLLNCISRPFFHDNRELLISVSLGAALFPDDGSDPQTLLRKADMAMYQAKAIGKNHFVFFTESMNQAIRRRAHVEEKMTGAIERGEFEVHYQALFSLKTCKLCGAEALLRWNNPELGQVSPAEFIPIAEQNGQIEAMGFYLIEQVLRDFKQFKIFSGQPFKVAMNLSPRQMRGNELTLFLESQMKKYAVAGAQLEFEVTENVLLSKQPNVKALLEKIHELGISISLDDFGTGYSSLHYLQEYHFDLVKIDRMFVQDITSQKRAKDLISAIIAMADSLEIKVLAEGVETPEQVCLLKILGCGYMQGFYMGPAVKCSDFVEKWGDAKRIKQLLTTSEINFDEDIKHGAA